MASIIDNYRNGNILCSKITQRKVITDIEKIGKTLNFQMKRFQVVPADVKKLVKTCFFLQNMP